MVGVAGVVGVVEATGSEGPCAGIIDGYSAARNDRFNPGTFPAGTPPTPNPTFFDSLYTYAWFVTFSLSFLLYLLLANRDSTT